MGPLLPETQLQESVAHEADVQQEMQPWAFAGQAAPRGVQRRHSMPQQITTVRHAAQ